MAGQLDPGIFRQILLKLNETYTDSLWENFQTLYLDFLAEESQKTASEWIVFEGVREVLENLRNNQIPIFLLTGNIQKGAFIKLETLSLAHYFDWENSVFGDDGKEKREELAVILKLKNKDSLHPVIIGDTPDDIKVGKLSGGISIAVSTGLHTHEALQKHAPDYLIKTLEDFPFTVF